MEEGEQKNLPSQLVGQGVSLSFVLSSALTTWFRQFQAVQASDRAGGDQHVPLHQPSGGDLHSGGTGTQHCNMWGANAHGTPQKQPPMLHQMAPNSLDRVEPQITWSRIPVFERVVRTEDVRNGRPLPCLRGLSRRDT